MKQTITILILVLSFQNVFTQIFHEDFSNGLPPNWVNEDLSQNDLLWEWCEDPEECPPGNLLAFFAKDQRFKSTTASNGYIFVEPTGNIAYRPRLTTDAINCENYDRVVLKFETHIFSKLSPPNVTALLRVRSGQGPWQMYKVFQNLGLLPEDDTRSCNPEIIYIDISTEAGNQSEVYLQWEWQTEIDHSWAIDDVELLDHHPLEENVVWGLNGEGDFSNGLGEWKSVKQFGFYDCEWYGDPVGWVGNSVFTAIPDGLKICSKTGNNGAAVLHAEQCLHDSGLGAGNQQPLICELYSPIIDLSNLAGGNGLILEFDQLVAEGNPTTPQIPFTSVMYSLDGGISWADTLDANPNVCFGIHNYHNSTFRGGLPPEVIGTAEFQLKFTFAGDLFFWVIDDVRILQKYDNDLKLNTNFFAIAPNTRMPASQLEPFGLLVDVENFGNFPQEDIWVFAEIENELGALIHQDSTLLGTLFPGELSENMAFEKLVALPPVTGKYKGRYFVRGTVPDDYLENNEIVWSFEVTEGIFAKETGGCIGTGFQPDNTHRFEMGNCFYIVNGDSMKATHVTFGIGNPSDLINESILTRLYKWKSDTSFADSNGDLLANPGEYEQIALNSYFVEGPEDTLVTIPIHFESSETIILEDSTWYFVTVSFENASIQKPFFIAGAEKYDYNATYFLGHELDKGIPQYFPVLRLNDDEDFSTSGFGLNRIPVVRLGIAPHVSSTHFSNLNNARLDIFPNPTDGQIFLNLHSEKIQKGLIIEILDICGKLVETRQFESKFVKQLPLSVDELPQGSYILRFFSETHYAIEKFVLIR